MQKFVFLATFFLVEKKGPRREERKKEEKWCGWVVNCKFSVLLWSKHLPLNLSFEFVPSQYLNYLSVCDSIAKLGMPLFSFHCFNTAKLNWIITTWNQNVTNLTTLNQKVPTQNRTAT